MEFRNKIADHCRRHSILYWLFRSQPEKKKQHYPPRIKFISYQERYSTQVLMNEPWEDNLITISFSPSHISSQLGLKWKSTIYFQTWTTVDRITKIL